MEAEEASLADLALLAGALSDPIRLRILDLLHQGPDATCHPPHPTYPLAICPSDLQRKLGAITPSKLSYHLRELQRVGLIQERRQGKFIYYLLQEESLSLYLEMLHSRYLNHNTSLQTM